MGLTILCALVLSAAAPAQSDTILEVDQVEDRLELLVVNPDRSVAALYLQQGAHIEGPIRLAPGENRLRYTLKRQGSPLSIRPVQISHYDASQKLVDQQSHDIIEPWDLPGHPVLALTPIEIRALRKRFLLEEHAGRVLSTLLDEADEQLAGPLYIPEVGGTTDSDYRCPDHGVFLEMVTLKQHRCPTDGQIWTGKDFDAALASILHHELRHQVWIQALAYTLTEDPAYAQRVTDILLGYADKYPGYIQHDVNGDPSSRGGKAFGQTLEEAIWLVDLVRGFDLLRGTGLLTGAESEDVRERIFRPAMHILLGNDLGILNIQNWHNSGILLAALTLGDFPAVDRVMRGPTGIQQQAQLGIDTDGMWYEGSFGYHFFTFRAMLPMLQTLQRVGVSLDVARVESMLLLPLKTAFPDGSLPMLNDGSFQTFAENLRGDYEQALAFWPRSEFCGPLVEYGRGKSYESIVYGLPDLPFQDWHDYPASNFEDAGLGALRSGLPSDRSTALLDYGQHGGFHGHFDKLGLSVWHRQKPILLESGAIGYGTAASEEYYPSTLAHNTIVIDGQNQQECDGVLQDYTVFGESSRLIVSADDAYAGVQLRRQVVNTEWGHIVDGVLVDAPAARTIDYVLHSADRIVHGYTTSAGDLGFGGAYTYLNKVRTFTAGQDLKFRFEGPDGAAVLNVIGQPGTQVFLAEAPGYPLGTTHDVLILRRYADHTVFGATITENGSAVDGFEVELDDAPGDPALFLRVLNVGQMRLPFYP